MVSDQYPEKGDVRDLKKTNFFPFISLLEMHCVLDYIIIPYILQLG